MTPAEPSQAWSVCELAVRRGYLSTAEAQRVRPAVERLSSADEATDCLLESGLLSEAEAAELRALWKTAADAAAGQAAVGGPPPGDFHLRATVPADGASPAARLPSIPGFEVISEVGRGGMGVVYKAWQANPPRQVALKVLLQGIYASEQSRQRFAREVAAAAHLSHPGVVPVHAAGEHDGVPYYTMEFVQGVALHEYLGSHSLSLHEKLELFGDVCGVVEHAHKQGLVHRDLKPSNIMIDEEGRVRVLDFGLAKFLVPPEGTPAGQLTEAGALLGTCLYMSPEQARGETDLVDERSDVYSLGVVLYEMLTGRLPHPEELRERHEILLHIASGQLRRPSLIDRSVRGDLETIILTCLDKDRTRRYADAGQLAADVARFLHIEPIKARPASLARRTAKFVRRNRIAVICGVLAVVAAAVTGLAMYGLPRLSALRKVRSPQASVRAEGWEALNGTGIGLREALAVLQNSSDEQKRLEALDFIDANRPEAPGKQLPQVVAGLLDDDSPALRERGAALFSKQASAAEIVQRLGEPLDPEVRRLLVEGLAGKDTPEVTPALIGLLLDSDVRIAKAAAEGLQRRVTEGRVTADEVARWMADPHRSVREFAVEAAGAFGSEPEVQRALLACVRRRDEDGVVRRGAAEALVRADAPVEWQAITQLLADEDEPAVAARLATLVGRSGHPDADEVLCRALGTVLADPFLQLWMGFAVELTRQIGLRGQATAEARDVLLRALAVPDADLRRAAIDAIGNTDIDPAHAAEWAMPLAPYLTDQDPSVRSAAIEAIRRLAAPESVPEVIRANLAAEDRYVSEQIERAMEGMLRRLADFDPRAAQQIVAHMSERIQDGTIPFNRRHVAIAALYQGESAQDLLRRFPAFEDPERLRNLGDLLDDQSNAIRTGAARWLGILTAGRLDPPTMGKEEVRELLRTPWHWKQGVLVPDGGG